MIKTYIRSKLSRQLSAVILAAFVFAGILYLTLASVIETTVCTYYDGHPEIVQRMAAEKVRALQAMADREAVASTDRAALSTWVGRNALMILQVFRNGRLIFDSTLETSSALHSHLQDHAPLAHQATQTIVFADGPAQVSIAVFPEHALVDLLSKGLLLLCVFLFLGVILWSVRRKIQYLVKLEQEVLAIAGGDLELPLTHRGTDELAMLSECIDEMRQSMIERIRQEESRQQERYEWVASMSHDLRTPLTALTGYLEVMARGGLSNPSRAYLQKCLEKAFRLKEMTDMLFASFTSSAPLLETLIPMPANELMRAFIQEGLTYLREKGYETEIRGATENHEIMIQKAALHRVFDNVFQNIAKYASPHAPVTVAWNMESDSRFSILIHSGLRGTALSHGSGFGLTICSNLIQNMGGDFRARAFDGVFEYRIELKARA